MESKLLIQMLLSLGTLLGVIISIRITKNVIKRFQRRHDFHERRIFYVNKIVTIFHIILFLLFFSIIWGFDIAGLPIYFASFFGLVGIAFFANWSILSNITASLIIFFSYRYRITDHIKVLEGDHSVSGKIKDMNMFAMVIETQEGDIVSYPNNLIIQKPVQVMKIS